MRVRCWGARGSIPVSGSEFVRYGGNTSCLELRTARDEIVVIDAGTGIRALGNLLMDEGRHEFTLLFTHSHWDHILGFPFFKPLYDSRTRINLYGCPLAHGDMQALLGKVMAPPYFPVPFAHMKARINYHDACPYELVVDTMTVTTIPISHPDRGVGYRFEQDGKKLVFLTDNELAHIHEGGRAFDDYVEFCRGADVLLHDAEFTEEEYRRTRGWGHSRYVDAVRLAIAAGVKRFGLYHHNQDRDDAGVDALVERCRELAAAAGSDGPECFGVRQHMEIVL